VNIQSFSNPTFRPPGVRIVEDDIIVKMGDGTRIKATEYPSTIIGAVKEKAQELVQVYVPADEMTKEQKERDASAVEEGISQILERAEGEPK